MECTSAQTQTLTNKLRWFNFCKLLDREIGCLGLWHFSHLFCRVFTIFHLRLKVVKLTNDPVPNVRFNAAKTILAWDSEHPSPLIRSVGHRRVTTNALGGIFIGNMDDLNRSSECLKPSFFEMCRSRVISLEAMHQVCGKSTPKSFDGQLVPCLYRLLQDQELKAWNPAVLTRWRCTKYLRVRKRSLSFRFRL